MVTDKTCGMSGDGFCTFYDADALSENPAESGLSDGEYMCPGCNETATHSGVESATEAEVEASRKAQNPAYGG